MVMQYWDLTAFNLLPSQDLRQLIWIYLTEPEHLQGVMRGLSYSPGSKHIRQTCSLFVISEWVYLISFSIINWLLGRFGCLKVKSSYTFLLSFTVPPIIELLFSAWTISLILIFCLPNFNISRYWILWPLFGKEFTTTHSIFCNVYVSPSIYIGRIW